MTGFGIEGRRDGAHALRELLDEEVRGARIVRGEGVQRRPFLGVGHPLRVDERHGVRPDVFGDDELHAGQPDAVVGNEAGLEGQLGVAEVDHDLGAGTPELVHVDAMDREGKGARVDLADVTLGARDGDRVAGVHGVRRSLGPHHRRDSQLSGDDGRVARPAAAVGDHGRRPLHHRLPVGRRGVADEDLAAP